MPRPGEEQDPVEDINVPDDVADPNTPKIVDLDEEDANTAEVAELDKLDRKEQNARFAAMRKEAAEAKKQAEEYKKKISEYESRKPVVQPQYQYPTQAAAPREHIGGVPVPQTKAEWDALVQKDWQLAVDMKATLKARTLQEEFRANDRAASVLEDTKQRVLQRHPELNDPNSEKAQIFSSVLDSNPEYLKMSKGPMLAMREMEDIMEERGFTREQIFDNKKVLAQNEATRVNRGALTGGGRMPEKGGRTVSLSKDDMEFCKAQGIDPKEYAKEKLTAEANKRGAQL